MVDLPAISSGRKNITSPRLLYTTIRNKAVAGLGGWAVATLVVIRKLLGRNQTDKFFPDSSICLYNFMGHNPPCQYH